MLVHISVAMHISSIVVNLSTLLSVNLLNSFTDISSVCHVGIINGHCRQEPHRHYSSVAKACKSLWYETREQPEELIFRTYTFTKHAINSSTWMIFQTITLSLHPPTDQPVTFSENIMHVSMAHSKPWRQKDIYMLCMTDPISNSSWWRKRIVVDELLQGQIVRPNQALAIFLDMTS